MEKLKEGEQYINININHGGIVFKYSAFPNPKYTPNGTQPRFLIKDNGGCVWLCKKKAEPIKPITTPTNKGYEEELIR